VNNLWLTTTGCPPVSILDSFGETVHEWDREAAMTPLGQLPFLIF
jgi:hypothetical protein